MSDSVTVQMQQLLDEINKDVEASMKRNINGVAKEAAQKLRNTSPKRTGDYASGWGSKKLGEMDAVVYNRKAPGLTHLLENGHMIVNKKGTFGRVSGRKHIKPVEEWGNDELPRRVMEDIP